MFFGKKSMINQVGGGEGGSEVNISILYRCFFSSLKKIVVNSF